MSIFRLFRRRNDLADDLAQELSTAFPAQFPKMPLLERRSDECAANLRHLTDEKAALEDRIADLQEQLRHVDVAIEAERERARIVDEGLNGGRILAPRIPLRVDSVPSDVEPFAGEAGAAVGAGA